MLKIAGMFFLLVNATSSTSHAQLINYTKDGNRIKYEKETTLITIFPEPFHTEYIEILNQSF
jgi:hypothetical protein